MTVIDPRLAQRASWINSLFTALLISLCLIISLRAVTTAALAQRNAALTVLRGSFVQGIGSFYQELADRAIAEGWSSYWLGVEGADGLIVGHGNQLDPSPPYRSFRVIIYRDPIGDPWFEVSVRTEVVGVTQQEAGLFDSSVQQQLSASRRAVISDVLRQVERYSLPSHGFANIAGINVSHAFLPIFILLIALALGWQLRQLHGDELDLAAATLKPGGTSHHVTHIHLISDDLAGSRLDPFSKGAPYAVAVLYVPVGLLTGWEPNLYFSERLPPVRPSSSLQPLLLEMAALLLVVRALRKGIELRRQLVSDPSTADRHIKQSGERQPV